MRDRIPPRKVASDAQETRYPVVVSLKQGQLTDGEREYDISYGMRATTKIVIQRGSVVDVLWRGLLRSVGRLGRPELRVANREVAL